MSLLLESFMVVAADGLEVMVITVFLVALLSVSYYVLFHPLNRERDLCDIGYGRKNKRELANQVRRLKKLGQLPPVFPNGWFAICESDQLKFGQVRPVYALGENLVVFRTEEGRACVLDAYCPHLGAHLGFGGRVVGDCIECPFHGWKFDGRDGHCSSIPYSVGKVPKYAQVKSWPVDEVNGFVFFWYHAEKEEPSWKIPVVEKLLSGTQNGRPWVYRGRSDYKVNAHIQEIPENGADVAHLAQLHGPSLFLGSDLQVVADKKAQNEIKTNSDAFVWHYWEAQWTGPSEGVDVENRHLAIARIRQCFRFLGRFSLFQTVVEVQQIGPGLVHLFIETDVGKCVFIHTATPVEPLVQHVVHRLYSAPSFIAPFAKLLLWGESIMFERDVAIWNHKTYIGRPLLVSEDQTIFKHRRWYKQFYSENSPRLQEAQSRVSSETNSPYDW